MDLEEAVEKARGFLARTAGYAFAQLVSARLEGGVWILRFDVGILERRIVTVKVDDRTGRIVGFEGPEQAIRVPQH